MNDEQKLWGSIDIMKERITRLEEQMKTVYNKTEKIDGKLDRLLEQSQTHNVDIARNDIQIGNGERFFWLIISAVIGIVLYWVKGG